MKTLVIIETINMILTIKLILIIITIKIIIAIMIKSRGRYRTLTTTNMELLVKYIMA